MPAFLAVGGGGQSRRQLGLLARDPGCGTSSDPRTVQMCSEAGSARAAAAVAGISLWQLCMAGSVTGTRTSLCLGACWVFVSYPPTLTPLLGRGPRNGRAIGLDQRACEIGACPICRCWHRDFVMVQRRPWRQTGNRPGPGELSLTPTVTASYCQ